jgi:hypothetical protein
VLDIPSHRFNQLLACFQWTETFPVKVSQLESEEQGVK